MIRRLTGTGHGAAAWRTLRRLERSYARQSASRMRMKLAGTIWAVVTRSDSMSRRHSVESHRAMITTVPPSPRLMRA